MSEPTPKPKAVKLKPYWAELGYELRKDGLFERYYTKLDGSTAHEVCVDAETFHRHRRHNLAVALALVKVEKEQP